MKIYSTNLFIPYFTGKRQDRKTVEQLKKNNSYDLNVINQRNINQAIDNLSQVPGEDNVNFLLDVSKRLKYGTNIDLNKTPYNDWQVKLNNAARKSIEISPEKDRPKLYAKLDRLTSTKKPLTSSEMKILDLRNSILSKVDRTALENIKNDNIKNFENNFDYLISSSEIPIAHKVYILKKLDYMLSPKYKINEQLADKKTQVLAEIVNDMVINTPESKIPNIKAINQRQHGMCAAISICRKALAYEDKPNYIDIILSELDNKPYMRVYDIAKLGSNSKISISKPYIDFEYALQNGYRIIDTSALNWMNIADTSGRCNEHVKKYITFDKEYFDTFKDMHIFKDINEELAPEQDYYRALLRSKSTISKCKKNAVLRDYKTLNMKTKQKNDISSIQKYSQVISKNITEIAPSTPEDEKRRIIKNLLSLEADNSLDIQNSDSPLKKFMYIKNEPETIKLTKIKAFLTTNLPDANSDKLNELAPDLLDLTGCINELQSGEKMSAAAMKINRAEELYNAAAAYRMQYEFGLDSYDRIREQSKAMNIPDSETLIIQNIDKLITKLQKGTLNPKIKEALVERLVLSNVENIDNTLLEALKENKEAFQGAITQGLDILYKSCLMENRKAVLLNNLNATRTAIIEENNKNALAAMSKELQLPMDKKKIVPVLDKYIEILNDENSTEEQYVEIYNKMGGKNQLADFKATLEGLGNILFTETAQHPNIIQGFNLLNGLPADAPLEKTLEVYQKIADSYNKLAGIVATFHNVFEIKTADGEILNTAIPKEVIMKKLEDVKEIVSAKDLKMFQDKFTRIENARQNTDGTSIYYKDLPSELTELTAHEKEVLKGIEKNINNWYSATTRNLSSQYKDYQEPLEELSREIGVKTGFSWISEGHSGLFTNNQIKIFEHMTGRPYYVEKDSNLAIEKIKHSPYSGISSMSMKSDEPAMHAQYIVDLKPVTVKTKDGEVQKEALFHDNTWGPAEYRNTWIDENGLIRTDYSMGSGGDLGFIIDSNYRSGKLLENLLDDVGEVKPDKIDNKIYKKLNKADNESYKFKMFTDIITPGEYPDLRSTIRSIKDNTTIQPDAFFGDLVEYAKNMTRDEVQQRISNIELLANNINTTYAKLEKRIWGKKPFLKGIETKEDYDKLPNDDQLKLLFEKAAILQSYYSIPEVTKIYSEKLTPENIQSLKKFIRTEARKNFDYTFGKSPEIAISGAKNSVNEIHELLVAYQMDTHVKISDAVIKTILKSTGKIDKSKFDGSLDTTIDLMVESFKETISTKTLNCENKEQKIDALAQKVRAVLKKNMYFNKHDMNTADFRRDNLPAIEKWIDDNFDPASDEEFVKIFNNMQKMTTEEFKEKYNYLIDDKTLGIKPITGYDVLKKFRALEDKTENILYNTLYFNELYTNTETSKTTPSYNFSKLSRVSKGAKYVNGKRSFDDIFMDYYFSLQYLTLDKLYGKYKDQAFKKYESLPAYAKVEIENKEEYEKSVQLLYTEITDTVDTISTIKKMLSTINDMKNLQRYINKIDDNSQLKNSQHNHILKIVTKLHNDYLTDDTMQNEVKIADEIIVMLNEGKSDINEYKKLINTLAKNIIPFEKTETGMPLSSVISKEVESIKQQEFSFIMQVVDPRYHKTAFEMLNKWIRAKAKDLPNADMYYTDFSMFLEKHKMINSPDKMLKDYMLLLAKPTEENDPYKEMTESQTKEIEEVKDIYNENITSLLYSANLVELQNILMRCAKNGNLNMIKEELKHTKLPLVNGRVTDFYSDTGLAMMLKDMYEENDLDTALMFIEQLGLGERVVEMYMNSTNFENAKKCIKRIHSVFEAVDKQVGIINKEVEKLSDIDTDPNYLERLKQAREKMNKGCMNTNFRITAKNVDKIMTAVIEELEKNPNQPKYKLLQYNIEYLRLKNIEFAKSYVDSLNSVLERIQAIQALMMNIKLPIGSKEIKIREEYFKKLAELQEYSKQNSATYKNINISTGPQAQA